MQNNPNDPTYQTPGQPYTQYPPYPPPPMARPPRKRRTWLWILLGAFAVLVLGCVGLVAIASTASQTGTTPQATSASGDNTPQAENTSAPTQAPATWKTIKTFKGSGSKKTQTFQVGDNWRIKWSCDPASFGGTQFNVIIEVDNADGSFADSGVNTLCKKGNTGDVTYISSGGTFLLNVTSEGDWMAEVQTQG